MKKVLSIALALMMSLSLIACGGQSSQQSAPAAEPAAQAEAPAEQAEAPAEQAEAPAEQAEAPAEQAEAPAEQAEAPAEQVAEAPALTPAYSVEGFETVDAQGNRITT